MFACAAAPRKRKDLHVSFGNTDVIEIESMPNANKRQNTSHDLSYKHTPEYQMLESSCEAHIARMKALSWHEIMRKEYGLPCLFGRHSNSGSSTKDSLSLDEIVPTNVAAAMHEADGWSIQDVRLT